MSRNVESVTLGYPASRAQSHTVSRRREPRPRLPCSGRTSSSSRWAAPPTSITSANPTRSPPGDTATQSRPLCCAAARSSEDCTWSNAAAVNPISPKQFLNKAPACLSIHGRKAVSSGNARRMEYPPSILRQGPASVDASVVTTPSRAHGLYRRSTPRKLKIHEKHEKDHFALDSFFSEEAA